MNGTRTTRADMVKTASGLNILLGIWLIVAPFLIGYTGVERAMWNDIFVGAVILILAAIRASEPLRYAGLSWMNAAIGIWLIIAPFALAYSGFPAPLWNDIVVGIAVAGLATWSASATQQMRPTA